MNAYRFHLKVFLATGVVEHFYPSFEKQKITLNDFILYNEETKDHMGWMFPRGTHTEYFCRSMVKAVSVGPFEGYVVNVDGQEIRAKSPNNEDVITALTAEQERLTKNLQAVKDYLKCKQ